MNTELIACIIYMYNAYLYSSPMGVLVFCCSCWDIMPFD